MFVSDSSPAAVRRSPSSFFCGLAGTDLAAGTSPDFGGRGLADFRANRIQCGFGLRQAALGDSTPSPAVP